MARCKHPNLRESFHLEHKDFCPDCERWYVREETSHESDGEKKDE